MASFESRVAMEEAQRIEALVSRLTNNYGFADERVREAIRATGPDNEQGVINWLLDHGEEDRGGAVTLRHCPHTDALTAGDLVRPSDLVYGQSCTEGCPGTENWTCLHCGVTKCSRYQNGHALQHYNETKAKEEKGFSIAEAAEGRTPIGHCLAISLSDLSVWCYECNAYADPSSGRNPILRPLVRHMEALKFGRPVPNKDGAASSSSGSGGGGGAGGSGGLVQPGGELHGSPEQIHGSRANPCWAAPRVSAVANEPARPGYHTCAAHEYLDTDEVLRAKMKVLADMVTRAKKATAYTGAGISTSSGINDYATKAQRGDQGRQLSSPYDAAPTLAHRVLVALHRAGRLDRWVQQNHDGLPQKAGFPQHKINEIHGAWFDPSNPVVPMDGTLRQDLLSQLLKWEDDSDLVLAFGSTMCGMNADRIATAAAQRCRAGKRGQQGLVIINLQQTQYDHLCALRVYARLDDAMQVLAEELKLALEEVKPPPPPEGDLFTVPYSAVDGSRGGEMCLDLQPGARLTLASQPDWDVRRAGTLATVVGRTAAGDWELELAGGKRRRLGAWWIREAIEGLVPAVPVVPFQP